MKLDYDSLPTLMLVAAGLFVMFASPPTVNYDEVASAGIITFQNDDNELNGNPYVLSDDEAMELVQKSTDAYNARDWEDMSALYTDDFNERMGKNL